jgi:hypothetical protein
MSLAQEITKVVKLYTYDLESIQGRLLRWLTTMRIRSIVNELAIPASSTGRETCGIGF